MRKIRFLGKNCGYTMFFSIRTSRIKFRLCMLPNLATQPETPAEHVLSFIPHLSQPYPNTPGKDKMQALASRF